MYTKFYHYLFWFTHFCSCSKLPNITIGRLLEISPSHFGLSASFIGPKNEINCDVLSNWILFYQKIRQIRQFSGTQLCIELPHIRWWGPNKHFWPSEFQVFIPLSYISQYFIQNKWYYNYILIVFLIQQKIIMISPHNNKKAMSIISRNPW